MIHFNPEYNEKILKWLHGARQLLQKEYCNQYIAYNAEGLVAHGHELHQVLESARASRKTFAIHFVPYRPAGSIVIVIFLLICTPLTPRTRGE